MSIGYETQIPPISTLTFYNTIANNGKMMRPRFVSKVMKNGETIMEFPPEVMRQQIAKEKSIKKLQTILEQVVSVGLGKKAGSPNFKVAGKTGTAQISKGAGGYKEWRNQLSHQFRRLLPCRCATLQLYRLHTEIRICLLRAVRCAVRSSMRFQKASWRRV